MKICFFFWHIFEHPLHFLIWSKKGLGACLWGDGADGDNKRTGVTLRRGPTLNFQAKEERGGVVPVLEELAYKWWQQKAVRVRPPKRGSNIIGGSWTPTNWILRQQILLPKSHILDGNGVCHWSLSWGFWQNEKEVKVETTLACPVALDIWHPAFLVFLWKENMNMLKER